ncbi:MAG: DUF1571 domain-containing protein, partial [Pirellulaceae bacterium]|nr:DUF1571 domain-containing protein [Pirellulaceae bacterium]
MPKLSSDLAIRAFVFSIMASIVCVDLSAQISEQAAGPTHRVGDNRTAPGFKESTKKYGATAPSTENEPLAPIDKALNIAEDGLNHIRTDIRDYTATMIKRERINGVVGDAEFIKIKIRSRREAEGVPLSIYMKFMKPSSMKGREVIWVEGRNNNKLTAHEGTGVLKHITASLDPEGSMAMKGNRYPIYEAGIENLVFRLIEKGQRDKEIGDANVKFYENIKINGRKCTLIQVKHPESRPEYDFHICRVFIDQ